MKPVLKVGDIVWASAGFGDGSYEEPATIIEVNVEYDESGDESDEEEKNQGQRHGGKIDGVRIKYKISLTETVLPSDQVRLFTPDTSRRRRRYKIPHSANGSLSEPSKQGSRVYPSGGGIPSFQSGTENEVKSRTILASTAIEERQNQASSTRSNAGAKMTLKVKDVHISKNEDDEEPLVNLKTGTVKSKTRSKKRKMDASRIDEKPKIVSNKSSKKAKRTSESSSSAANSKHSVRTSKVISSPYFDSEKAKTNIEVNTKEDSSSKIEMKGARMRDFKKSKVSNDDCGAIGGEPDGNGGLDQGSTYIVEYAKTSRSTCKRCNERIKKGELRIGNRPLFRGKPGFQVFKHLKCTVFSEEISCAEDIGGSSKLKGEDYESLTTRVQASVKELKRESEELTPDELVQKEFSGDIRSAPKGLSAELLPFQIEGVSWMYHQETKTDIKGGILADEMGMGKTLQTITTILDNRPKLQRSIPGSKYPPCTTLIKDAYIKEEALWDEGIKDWKHEMVMNDVHKSILTKSNKNGSGGGARAGTLVICPLIALLQWKTEIEKFSQDGSISVKIYHGPDRSSKVPREMLRKYDIVLTTYQVLQADFRKMVSPNRVKCPNCGGKFRIDKLRVHLKYFCGENAERTEAQARQRRNSDQQRVNQTRRRGGHLNTNNSKPKSSKTKMAIKVKGNANYDSESELSMDSNDNTEKKNLTSVRRRPSSRASASNAAKKMTKTSKWEDKISGSDTDDEYEEESEEESDSNDNHSFVSGARKTAPRNKTKVQSKNSGGNEYTKRAVAKQAKALKTAKLKKFDKKKESKLKTNAGKGKKVNQKKNVPLKKGKGEQKNCSESDDSSEDDDDIDMDALIEEAMAGAQMSMLHSFSWWRIVLDEAHMIKSRSSQTAAAAFALIGIHRWCLSGTPLQNRVGEFYSLVRFLRLDPMAYYFCRAKGCDCKQIHYRMSNGRCKDCGHGQVQHYSYFNRHILNPIQRDGYSHDGRRAMFVLKNEVLDKCLLRRTKASRAEDMELPPRIVSIKAVKLHPIEEDFYNALYTQTSSSFSDYVADGTLLNNYAHIFDLLMRMRQSVSHPYLVVYSNNDRAANLGRRSQLVANGTTDCVLCHNPPSDRVTSTCCQAAFCRSCVLDYMATSAGLGGEGGTPCPNCSNPFSIDLNQVQETVDDEDDLNVISSIGLPSLKELSHVATNSILRRIDLTKFATSTKIEALIQELVEMRKKRPGSKAIVFSQFVNMLDLIRWRLHSDPFLSDMGLGVKALHGGMNIMARDDALRAFREDTNVRVLLMSLKAGGVALNLTVANHIYLMDPWWNPAAEMQAIDRTHRFGQYKAIRAVRFIAENTVEERILQLQEKKRLVFDGTVGRDAGSLKMLTVDDMKSLFA